MAFEHSLMLLGILIFLISMLLLTKPSMAEGDQDIIPANFSRSYFPDDFIFGTATSAYQVFIIYAYIGCSSYADFLPCNTPFFTLKLERKLFNLFVFCNSTMFFSLGLCAWI